MDDLNKVTAYFEKEHPFKKGIAILRHLAGQTSAVETFKWQAPVYTIDGKNVFWIARFKHHFGLGFFNGSVMKDPKKVLVNAQEGKTQAMRHWKFTFNDTIDEEGVLAYMNEALDNQKKGIAETVAPKEKKTVKMPQILEEVLDLDKEAKNGFAALTPYKQNEYISYIVDAKQEKTKLTRLKKIIPLLKEGKGLNDRYR